MKEHDWKTAFVIAFIMLFDALRGIPVPKEEAELLATLYEDATGIELERKEIGR